ncbi:MAG: DUF4349 domain-containing protein [Deltaproteobacteria bacterium]|nr:DUF4349 domain-containing protein [Deltaproteobacteria bacterium]
MKSIISKALLITVLLVILGCSADHGEKALVPTLSGESETPAAQEQLPVDKKLIKEGEIYFETSNLAKTRAQIDEAIKRRNAYISREDEETYRDSITQTVVIRVPAEHFDDLVADISRGIKKFDRKSIETTDVTEEYLDIELRIKIKKETEDRYRQLLTQAKTVKDILAIEEQIGKLRTEIESIEGRLKYLQDRISYSTVTVTFYEKISTPIGFSSQFNVGLQKGWKNFVWFVIGLIHIWPFILLAFLGFFGIRMYRKRRKTKKKKKN